MKEEEEEERLLLLVSVPPAVAAVVVVVVLGAVLLAGPLQVVLRQAADLPVATRRRQRGRRAPDGTEVNDWLRGRERERETRRGVREKRRQKQEEEDEPDPTGGKMNPLRTYAAQEEAGPRH
ncbi:hypothetical protein EYF80_006604 [Liparis tanakae]|uniref:Uncharacterized protein n=1 Tax=Liparis tanakae TaxID=230148 RepID=A0A4Z2IZ18_9TELE|nr:hypothetical protein EYF80_006604 [Liparis tanakae]